MSACWVFMILMGYRLSHASQPDCKVPLKTALVPPGGNVLVPCPLIKRKEVTFSLFKDQEMIYNCSRSHEENGTNCKPQYTRWGVVLNENAGNKSVHFRLTGVNASSFGVYKCDCMVTFPPPLVKVTSDFSILVLLDEPKCKGSNSSCKTDVENSQFPWWIPVVVLSIYSLITTIIVSVCSMKLRNAEFQNDYINTKPSAARGRGKKRGVKNPIPRHF